MKSSFINRVYRAIKIDPELYEEVEHDKSATIQAALVVIFSSLAAGIGAIHLGASNLIFSFELTFHRPLGAGCPSCFLSLSVGWFVSLVVSCSVLLVMSSFMISVGRLCRCRENWAHHLRGMNRE